MLDISLLFILRTLQGDGETIPVWHTNKWDLNRPNPIVRNGSARQVARAKMILFDYRLSRPIIGEARWLPLYDFLRVVALQPIRFAALRVIIRQVGQDLGGQVASRSEGCPRNPRFRLQRGRKLFVVL